MPVARGPIATRIRVARCRGAPCGKHVLPPARRPNGTPMLSCRSPLTMFRPLRDQLCHTETWRRRAPPLAKGTGRPRRAAAAPSAQRPLLWRGGGGGWGAHPTLTGSGSAWRSAALGEQCQWQHCTPLAFKHRLLRQITKRIWSNTNVRKHAPPVAGQGCVPSGCPPRRCTEQCSGDLG